MRVLEDQIIEIKKYFDHHDTIVETVSKVNIGWQLTHILLVMLKVIGSLSQSNPGVLKKRFNFNKSLAFTLGFITRGKFRAPKAVSPKRDVTKETLTILYGRVEDAIQTLKLLDPKAHFNHPVLGILDKKDTIKFFELHNEHHLKIVRDILKAK